MSLPGVRHRARRARSGALPVRSVAGLVVPGALTLGSSYELVTSSGIILPSSSGAQGSVLRLKLRRTFDFALGGAPGITVGRTWLNSARVTTSALNGTDWEITHDATNTDWPNGAAALRKYGPTPGARQIVARLALVVPTPAGGTFPSAEIVVHNDQDTAVYARFALAYNGVSPTCWLVTSAGNTNTGGGLTVAEIEQGVWILAVIVGDQVAFYFSTANQVTPPTSWTPLGAGAGTTYNMLSKALPLQAGLHVKTSGNASGPKLIAKYFDDSAFGQVSFGGHGFGPVVSAIGGGGYDPASPAIVLGDWDLGDHRAVLTTAEIRSRLAERINVLPGDAGTWTFSLTRGPSGATPAAATTYQSAAALDVKTGGTDTVTTTGRRAALRARCASNGTQSGSLDLGFGFPVLI